MPLFPIATPGGAAARRGSTAAGEAESSYQNGFQRIAQPDSRERRVQVSRSFIMPSSSRPSRSAIRS